MPIRSTQEKVAGTGFKLTERVFDANISCIAHYHIKKKEDNMLSRLCCLYYFFLDLLRNLRTDGAVNCESAVESLNTRLDALDEIFSAKMCIADLREQISKMSAQGEMAIIFERCLLPWLVSSINIFESKLHEAESNIKKDPLTAVRMAFFAEAEIRQIRYRWNDLRQDMPRLLEGLSASVKSLQEAVMEFREQVYGLLLSNEREDGEEFEELMAVGRMAVALKAQQGMVQTAPLDCLRLLNRQVWRLMLACSRSIYRLAKVRQDSQEVRDSVRYLVGKWNAAEPENLLDVRELSSAQIEYLLGATRNVACKAASLPQSVRVMSQEIASSQDKAFSSFEGEIMIHNKILNADLPIVLGAKKGFSA